ncbi:FAD-dependent monooxygenase [Pseudosulfitobacter sp. SM2401]|uniref:FAD-dependent monooxygenase n=1 Tax=Pseudosulfitobacter sp. SM2401 TaxID=3350098 RepID=UPI0036F1A7D4
MTVRSAIVIGGGIAGLATAAVLGRAGASVTVLEQADALREVGAGLQISPNGMVVLRALSLETELKSRGGVRAQAVSLRDYKRAGEIARLDLARLAADQRYYFVHRADVLDLLKGAAKRAGADIVLGAHVADVIPGDMPEVRLSDGTTRRAELIVAADGVHSVARGVLNPQSSAFFTKQVAWRAVVPNVIDQGPEAHVYMAPGQHIVSYPIRGSAFLNLVAVEERDAWADEGWNHTGDPQELRARFAQFQGDAAQTIGAVTDVSIWGLFRHPVATNWGEQGVVLVGDSAHPTLPFLAQGANMALEDAWALGRCLNAHQGDAALAAYTVMRKARVSRIIKTANGNAWRYHLRHGPVRFGAHAVMRLGSRLTPSLMIKPFDWLYRYDVTGSGT